MSDHGAVSASERQLVLKAYAEADGRKCSGCRGPVKPVFTWNVIRPYYFVCAGSCRG